MKIEAIKLNTYSRINNKNVLMKKTDISFQAINPNITKKINWEKVGAGALALATLAGGAIVAIKKGLFKKSNFRLMDTSMFKNVDLEQKYQKGFLEDFIKPLQMKTLKDGAPYIPENGYIVYGPSVKERNKYMDWMLSELEKQGVEIIEPCKGKPTDSAEVVKVWQKMWEETPAEEFQKNRKYKAFVVRDLDEAIPFPVRANASESTPRVYRYASQRLTNHLADGPNSSSSCKRNGIMLFYTATNRGLLEPSCIRTMRVNTHHLIKPSADESLDIWKEYLSMAKKHSPSMAVNKINEAKKILSQKGADVMKEMEPHFAYTIPHNSPYPNESLKTWQKYTQSTLNNVDSEKGYLELLESMKFIATHTYTKNIEPERFNAIRKAVEECTNFSLEQKKLWDDSISKHLAGFDTETL